jgi:hypothetical protein
MLLADRFQHSSVIIHALYCTFSMLLLPSQSVAKALYHHHHFSPLISLIVYYNKSLRRSEPVGLHLMISTTRNQSLTSGHCESSHFLFQHITELLCDRYEIISFYNILPRALLHRIVIISVHIDTPNNITPEITYIISTK